ncbi:SDR family NAD(P)-dependent oxidoreductase [Luteibacter yeojuensis]|nr:SDR family oxidoreductase [Luteibacter yeojuensis]
MTSNMRRRVALVTGGSRGLGRAEVLALAARGIDCLFTYSARRDEAEKVAAEARAPGVEVHALQLDQGNVPTLDGFVDRVKATLAGMGVERIDYLVNNAGISNHTAYAEVTEEELDRLYAINFKGVFFLTQKLLPLINDGGRIINTSSGLVRFVFPDLIAYASSKASLETFTRYLAHELGPRGITVNTIAPGAMGTDFNGGMIRDNAGYRERIAGVTALGRPGVPDDIGPMVASLLDDSNRWINAQRIEVSGGMKL